MVMLDTLLTVFTLSIVKTGGGVRCGVIKCITPYCTNWWAPLGFSNSNPLTLHIFSIGVLGLGYQSFQYCYLLLLQFHCQGQSRWHLKLQVATNVLISHSYLSFFTDKNRSQN